MRKTVSIILAFSLVILLVGCGKESALSSGVTSTSGDVAPFTELITK